MEATGHRVTLEQVCLPEEPTGDRYDVTVHDAGDHGEEYAFDFTVGLATAASYINGSSIHPPGWLARRLDRLKADHTVHWLTAHSSGMTSLGTVTSAQAL